MDNEYLRLPDGELPEDVLARFALGVVIDADLMHDASQRTPNAGALSQPAEKRSRRTIDWVTEPRTQPNEEMADGEILGVWFGTMLIAMTAWVACLLTVAVSLGTDLWFEVVWLWTIVALGGAALAKHYRDTPGGVC